MDFDSQNSKVVILCEKYLQEDSDAMMLLNQIINHVADMALIDERNDGDDEFDYAEEMEDLISSMKLMNHSLESNNLLLMGNYSEHVANKQEKNHEKENV